ncbi:MAG: Fe-S protein assembly co-chaperone HscB [Gammaproteobacteria bacterium WSBS_2016_MAG_OTU1]
MDDFFSCDYFTLFGVPQSVNINADELQVRYQSLQSMAHPDRFVGATDADKRAALQMAARINDAYNTLQNPLQCAAYLLFLHGIIAFAEDNTAMPADFLMQQLEWREALEDASTDEYAKLVCEITAVRDKSMKATIDAISAEDYATATENIRQWKYLEKMLVENP